jgi:endonuclease/exonuclease/phosphatase family metal-dependent hydrolase
MPKLRPFAVASLLAVAALACGGGSSTTSQATSASPLAPSGANRTQFRVMTFNIQHGLNGAGRYDLKYAIDTIAKVNPDLVGIQELTRNHPFYKCEDQPAVIAEGLSAATGRQWTAVYQQEWTTQIRDCQNSGRGDGAATEGLGFFAPRPLGTPSFTQLWNGRIGLMTMMSDVPVIVTHLAHAAAGQADRVRQLNALLPWSLTQQGSGPRILLGDFNFWPDSPEYASLKTSYRDAWEDALAAGTARGRLDGITHKTVRIDYVFYVPGGRMDLLWVENVDTRALTGVEASDHNPVVAAFGVR